MSEPTICDGNCYECDAGHAPMMILILASMGITPELAVSPENKAAVSAAQERMREEDEGSPDPAGMGFFDPEIFKFPRQVLEEMFNETELDVFGLKEELDDADQNDEHDDLKAYSSMEEDDGPEDMVFSLAEDDEPEHDDHIKETCEDVPEYDAAKVDMTINVTFMSYAGDSETINNEINELLGSIADSVDTGIVKDLNITSFKI